MTCVIKTTRNFMMSKMDHSKPKKEMVDDSDDEEIFSDAIASNDKDDADDFFDVPEWRQDKSEPGDDEEEDKLTEASIEDIKEQKLKERLELEDKMSPEDKEKNRTEAQELKKSGNDFYLSGANNEAIEKYDQALDLCPLQFKQDRSILYANKAACLLKLDQKEKAIESCSAAIELNPDYVKALLRRGQTYEDSDKPHEALKDFEKVLELDPGNKDARIAIMVSCIL